MSPRDTEARIVEQFLKTMAPPAAMTASYRHRVVRASLETRMQVLAFRRIQRVVIMAVALVFVLLAPGYVLTQSPRWYVIPALQIEASDVTEAVAPVWDNIHSPFDGRELSALQSRTDAWAALQNRGDR